MKARLNRRDALLQTAAMATASAFFPGVATPARALSGNGEIDAILRASVDASDAAGVVAMAANESSIVYQGAFG
ncbi:MAG TPA: serine hydrolase, partial [Bradyrhizobium sp.]|nr:serine hydrolase [Bradyrhizobium sp.]